MNLTYRQPFVFLRNKHEKYVTRRTKSRGIPTALLGLGPSSYTVGIAYAIYYSSFISRPAYKVVLKLAGRPQFFKTRNLPVSFILGGKWEL